MNGKVTALNANSMQIEGVHKVTYYDQTYLIGAESDDVSFSNSKEELIHKIVTMTAIGLHVDNDDTVNVAIGCPISEYRNDEKRKSYLDYILPSGGNRVEIFIDGKKSSSTSADVRYLLNVPERCICIRTNTVKVLPV